MRLLEATFVAGNFTQRCDTWEKAKRDHERLSKKVLDPDLAIGVLQQRLAPSAMTEYLALNGSKFESYDKMKDAIEEYIEHFGVIDDEVQSGMEVGYIDKGKGKKGKGKGKEKPWWQEPKGGGKGKKGKGKGKKGKGKGKQKHKGYGTTPWVNQNHGSNPGGAG